eukprot:COSAG01_NODE_5867_length_3982_cov_7.929178_4_plen_90_part_00
MHLQKRLTACTASASSASTGHAIVPEPSGEFDGAAMPLPLPGTGTAHGTGMAREELLGCLPPLHQAQASVFAGESAAGRLGQLVGIADM